MSVFAQIFLLTFLCYVLYHFFKLLVFTQLTRDLEKEKAYHKHLLNRRRENTEMFTIRFKKLLAERDALLTKMQSYETKTLETIPIEDQKTRTKIQFLLINFKREINNYFFDFKRVVEDFEDTFLMWNHKELMRWDAYGTYDIPTPPPQETTMGADIIITLHRSGGIVTEPVTVKIWDKETCFEAHKEYIVQEVIHRSCDADFITLLMDHVGGEIYGGFSIEHVQELLEEEEDLEDDVKEELEELLKKLDDNEMYEYSVSY